MRYTMVGKAAWMPESIAGVIVLGDGWVSQSRSVKIRDWQQVGMWSQGSIKMKRSRNSLLCTSMVKIDKMDRGGALES